MALMDEAERKRFLDTLRSDEEFRAAVRRELLTDELLELPQTVATLRESVATLVDVVAQQSRDFQDLARDVHRFTEAAISAIQAVAVEVKEGFAAVDARFDQVEVGMTTLRTDMEIGFVAVDARLDQVKAEIQEIRDRLAS